jgi:6-pyruvoyltetrahydropterin/6-carboxytetrahydropterin synthase
MFKLRVKDCFEAGHYLPDHPECGRQHGHTYRVEVVVGAEVLNSQGMVVDLHRVREALGRALGMLDHDNLNNHFAMPTVEVVAQWLYDWLFRHFPGPVTRLVEVTVWETDDGGVTYDGPSA